MRDQSAWWVYPVGFLLFLAVSAIVVYTAYDGDWSCLVVHCVKVKP